MESLSGGESSPAGAINHTCNHSARSHSVLGTPPPVEGKSFGCNLVLDETHGLVKASSSWNVVF